MTHAYLLANFGGPRHNKDIEAFLTALLTDPDVTGAMLPRFLHKRIFTAIAKRRAPKILPLYDTIGGCSPIYQDTESLAHTLASHLRAPVISFHRYLPDTHALTIEQLSAYPHIIGIPLFPHFTYAVTGSIVKCVHQYLPHHHIQWIAHFGNHPLFVTAMVNHIRSFLLSQEIAEENCCLLFSAHSLPVRHIRQGDPYQTQCARSFQAISQQLKPIQTCLCYQSKFGVGRWLSPSTRKVCTTLRSDKEYAIIVPFGFTSDHIETLYEIEKEYLPLLTKRKFKALRMPTMHQTPTWGSTLTKIILDSPYARASQLMRD